MDDEIKHQIYWDEEKGIVRAIGNGPADEISARWFLAKTEQMARDHGYGLNWLVDLSGITSTTSSGRRILAEASSHPSIHKYAMIGGSLFLRTVANFIQSTAGKEESRHFSSEEQALAWFGEES